MMSALQLPVSRSSFALRIASMDSFFDASIKPQVFTITTSASCAFWVTCMPSRSNEPSMTSLSTRFFAQPRLTNPTLMAEGELIDSTDTTWLRRVLQAQGRVQALAGNTHRNRLLEQKAQR